jgi:hypothetical protein
LHDLTTIFEVVEAENHQEVQTSTIRLPQAGTWWILLPLYQQRSLVPFRA